VHGASDTVGPAAIPFPTAGAAVDSRGARRLCESGARAWVVYGEQDDVGLTDTERTILNDCPITTVLTIAGTGHLIPITRLDVVANLITHALHENPRPQRSRT